jgi:hypothetical protein
MLHGKNARFPPGATVYLLKGALDHLPAGEKQGLLDELASVKSYDAVNDLWEVAPSRPQFGGKTVFVKEPGMRLAFCILAENALPGGATAKNANPAAAAFKRKRKIKRAPAPNGSKLRGGRAGVRLVTWTVPAVVNWCLPPYALLGLSLLGGARLVTWTIPGALNWRCVPK